MEKPGGVGLATKHHGFSFISDEREVLWCSDERVVFDGKALVSKTQGDRKFTSRKMPGQGVCWSKILVS